MWRAASRQSGKLRGQLPINRNGAQRGGVGVVGESQVEQHADVGIGQPVEGPSPAAADRHHPVRAQQAQCVRHPGLALPARVRVAPNAGPSGAGLTVLGVF